MRQIKARVCRERWGGMSERALRYRDILLTGSIKPPRR
jgi:hypothetical protein